MDDVVAAGRYRRRRAKSSTMLLLCWAATIFGLSFLLLILLSLVIKGASSLSISLLVQPISGGGLANAIFGSILLSLLGIVVAAPIGLLAGTYLAEYGRYSRLAGVIRFVNDILLSAPSIIIGLFIYGAVVVPMGTSSGFAGALALAVIALPVIVRTTEDMLLLVPNTLREAAVAMGMPRSRVILRVAYRAARSGILTGLLLAVARISGETAPLIFTSGDNNYWNLNLFGPEMQTLPVAIYTNYSSPDPSSQNLIWGAALIISILVLGMNVSARLTGNRRMTQ